jgi:SAM-dependent methyltransferase
MFEGDYVEFCKKWLNINAEKVHGGKILEVGIYESETTIRKIAEKMNPKSYISVDNIEGIGADKEMEHYYLSDLFGHNFFDVVISVREINKMKDWKKLVREMSLVLNVEGILILTAMSPLNIENYQDPNNEWLFTKTDLYNIFQGFSIQEITENDQGEVFFVGVKKEIALNDISGISVSEVTF